MKKLIKSEEEVKKILGIKDFRKLSKKKVIEFASLLPNMNKEVAKSVIAQFPKYSDMVNNIVSYFSKVCNKKKKKGSDTTKESIKSYIIILDSLKEQLQDKNLSFEQQEKISNKMIEVADKIAKLDAEHKNFIKDIMKGLGGIAIVGLGFAGAILGINLKKK